MDRKDRDRINSQGVFIASLRVENILSVLHNSDNCDTYTGCSRTKKQRKIVKTYSFRANSSCPHRINIYLSGFSAHLFTSFTERKISSGFLSILAWVDRNLCCISVEETNSTKQTSTISYRKSISCNGSCCLSRKGWECVIIIESPIFGVC